MKKITILNKDLSLGSTEQYISSLSNILSDNYDIELIIGYKLGDLPSYYINNRNKVEYLIEKPYDDELLYKCKKRRKFIKYIANYINKKRIQFNKLVKEVKRIKTIDSDYLITTNIFDHILVSLFNINKNVKKIAVDFNSPSLFHKILLFISSIPYSKIIVINDEIRRKYKRLFKARVFTISNFIDTDVEAISSLNTKNIISIGKLNKNRGYSDLLDIMSILVKKDSEITLTLVGDGVEAINLRNRINELNLQNNVTLTGNLSVKETERRLLSSSVYAMCTKEENYGINLLEAMNYGLPTFAFDSASSAKKILNDGSGILVSGRNIEEYADRLYRMLNDKDLLNQYSERSLRKVQNYSITKAKYAWINILEELTYIKD